MLLISKSILLTDISVCSIKTPEKQTRVRYGYFCDPNQSQIEGNPRRFLFLFATTREKFKLAWRHRIPKMSECAKSQNFLQIGKRSFAHKLRFLQLPR